MFERWATRRFINNLIILLLLASFSTLMLADWASGLRATRKDVFVVLGNRRLLDPSSSKLIVAPTGSYLQTTDWDYPPIARDYGGSVRIVREDHETIRDKKKSATNAAKPTTEAEDRDAGIFIAGNKQPCLRVPLSSALVFIAAIMFLACCCALLVRNKLLACCSSLRGKRKAKSSSSSKRAHDEEKGLKKSSKSPQKRKRSSSIQQFRRKRSKSYETANAGTQNSNTTSNVSKDTEDLEPPTGCCSCCKKKKKKNGQKRRR